MNVNAYPDGDSPPDEDAGRRRLRFELIFASLWLAFGLFLLPALIFWVGGALLGAYGDGAGLSTFYIDFFGDLADLSGRAWTIALGPFLLMYSLRAVFIGARAKQSGEPGGEEEEEQPPPAVRQRPPAPRQARRPAARAPRVEPRMGAD